MIIKVEELREATDWQVPIFIKMGASRVYDDVKLAAKAGADVMVLWTLVWKAAPEHRPLFSRSMTGIPTLAAVCEARVGALEDIGLYGEDSVNHRRRDSRRRGRSQSHGSRRRCLLHRNGVPNRAQL